MSIYRRRPNLLLTPFIEWLWYYVDYCPDHDREHVLPDGTFELVINLQEIPRKLFDRDRSGQYRAFRRGWISGAHTRYLVIDALPCSSMIGVHFRPGGAAPFLGIPADELGEAVVELDDVWGQRIWEWRDRLLGAHGPEAKFRVLEEVLVRMLTTARSRLEPAVTWAVAQFMREADVPKIADISARVGISHKQFIHQFKRQVGLTPKKFCRIRRFQEALAQIQSTRPLRWADLASGCGYFDQAHFIHDFGAFCGMNPSAYLERRLEGDTKFARAVG